MFVVCYLRPKQEINEVHSFLIYGVVFDRRGEAGKKGYRLLKLGKSCVGQGYALTDSGATDTLPLFQRRQYCCWSRFASGAEIRASSSRSDFLLVTRIRATTRSTMRGL